MKQPDAREQGEGSSLTRSALDSGLSAISLASSGAKLAVGTLFAGANVLLDLGVRVTRQLPLNGDRESAVSLKTAEGEIQVAARPVAKAANGPTPLGWWTPDAEGVKIGAEAIRSALSQVRKTVYVVDCDGELGVGTGGRAVIGADTAGLSRSYPLRAIVPAVLPESLGDPAFLAAHGVKYPYIAGAMAHGITSPEMVEAMARAGMLGFYGAAGLGLDRVEAAIDRLQRNLGDTPFGVNLIHSPNEPDHEAATVELYLTRGVRLVSASAYLDLTLPLVRYRVHGIHRDASGRVVCPNKVIAKVSRVEVARRFLSPPPAAFLNELVQAGEITHEQAGLAESIPMAEDLTAEADSGGHTDNRPAVSLIPTMIALRDELQAQYGYATPPRVGAAGGIATPASAAAAFAMGAAYVLTGSINQACVEAGTSSVVREMLSKARQADIIMAPAADMFEMGVKVQVLKWGTMFAVRARKLHDLYREYGGLDELPDAARASLEKDYFRCSLDEAWASTRRFWEGRDPKQVARAERDEKHKMALVFRSYLGQASHWANAGEASRKVDYQIWCGPAMGAFNEWTRGSFLEQPQRRDVVTVAMNLLVGAAVRMRANWLRAQRVPLPASADGFAPIEMKEVNALLGE